MSKDTTMKVVSIKPGALNKVQENIMDRVLAELKDYLLNHEFDIAWKENDFGELYNTFQFIVGRPPSKDDQ